MCKHVLLVAALALSTAAATSAAEPLLSVTQAGPEGECSTIEQANEVRIQFSEPMVALGAAAGAADIRFVKFTPDIEGEFHWSGTRLLIFKPAVLLPYATRYTVTVDTTAMAVSGHRLKQPHTFAFTTPTVRLVRGDHYRKGGTADSPAVFVFLFNQPVDPASVSRHLKLTYEPHEWTPPLMQQEVLARIGREKPDALIAFQNKVLDAARASTASKPVQFKLADEWDLGRFPRSASMVVVETTEMPPPGSHVRAELDETLPSPAGRATPGASQSQLFELPPALFITGLSCKRGCSWDSYTTIEIQGNVRPEDIAAKVTVIDITDPASEAALVKEREVEGADWYFDEQLVESEIALDWLGFDIKPARTYLIKIDRSLKSVDGQTLGYDWYGRVEYIHEGAYVSFGLWHGVWEKSGGPVLPFYARNLVSVRQWLMKITPDTLVDSIMRMSGYALNTDGSIQRKQGQTIPPGTAPTVRRLKGEADKTTNFGFDLSSTLSPAGTGLGWAALEAKEAIPNVSYMEPEPYGSIIQVTNLGITVKDSPQNTLIMVTRLDDGRPVEGAEVAIRTLDNKVFWQGITGADGTVLAPGTDIRSRLKLDSWDIPWTICFVVTARLGDDFAYVASDWNDGIMPWDFNYTYDISEAKPVLRGGVFADRGVYKLGEEVHFKAICRHDTVNGMRLIPAGTTGTVTLNDTNGKEIEKRTVALNEWSSAEWTTRLPKEGAFGGYSVQLSFGTGKDAQSLHGSFLVAAYRKPDFRVDATIGAPELMAGTHLTGIITARFLSGGVMSGRPVKVTYSKAVHSEVPASILDKFAEERYQFLRGAWSFDSIPQGTIFSRDETLASDGSVTLDLETDLAAGRPFSYTIEGEVTDVSRQTLAGRASAVVHPAPWYLGLKRFGYIVEAGKGISTEVVAVTPRGEASSGVPVKATLMQVQWKSVRRAEGGGFYTWETQRVEEERWTSELTTGAAPVPLTVPLTQGGYYILKIEASDKDGRRTLTDTDFYAIGAGYTAWERFDHNRIELVPERKLYRPGDTARILVKSPWEGATALLTVEREGIRSHKTFNLSSTQETVEVPVTENDLPNLYVSVLLIKGRSSTQIEKDGSDPGKPAFRLGYTQIKVDNGLKHLSVEIKSNKDEYRPAEDARITVTLKDRAGKPVVGEVTLWAVDYGVLSLTGYKTPDVIDQIFVQKNLQVLTSDSRQRLVSRRVITPKGEDAGGGGGYDEGPGNAVRKDFRVLAFWVGSGVTDAQGRLEVTQKLPESLTTFRVMAVAHDKANRFGSGEREIRVSKPVQLRPAFPRFLTLGDKANFGGVVQSLLKNSGKALVTIRSLDPSVLEIVGEATRAVEVTAGGAAEARFGVAANSVGEAGVVMSVKLLGEEDAFEAPLPVRVMHTPETTAAYGTAAPSAEEKLALPAGIVPEVGGLHIELASTAMVGLGEGARYLVDYPYGCAEQKSSAALALMLTADLGEAFTLPGFETKELSAKVAETLEELEAFQCEDGGFAFWKGDCRSASPYLTSNVLHVMQRAKKLEYKVSESVMARGLSYLEEQLGAARSRGAAFESAETAWQAFAAKVLAEGGRTADSHITRLYAKRDRMPVFALCYLWDAMAASGESGRRFEEMRRRVSNAILPEGGSAHVEDMVDPYLSWFWSSHTRSTAIALGSLVRNGGDRTTIGAIVRWLMSARKGGRWGNTQENSWAMESLVDYYRKYEADVPDFDAGVLLGSQVIMSGSFEGRGTEAQVKDIPVGKLPPAVTSAEGMPLRFEQEAGAVGTLHYGARMTYARTDPLMTPLDAGFVVDRSYAPLGGGGVATTFKAGDLVAVTLTLALPKERRHVAVRDPIPAGFEAVESWFATTRRDLTAQMEEDNEDGTWWERWMRGGFDHVERHDDRVLLFATRLSEGTHTFRYVCRATTSGEFRVAPATAEEMYEPEVFGRTADAVIKITD